MTFSEREIRNERLFLVKIDSLRDQSELVLILYSYLPKSCTRKNLYASTISYYFKKLLKEHPYSNTTTKKMVEKHNIFNIPTIIHSRKTVATNKNLK